MNSPSMERNSSNSDYVGKRLTLTETLKTAYCIPLWLRDEQIKQSITRVSARIEPHYELRQEPIAVVCYGPSLADTWESIPWFKYVMSCSGSHRFLIDHGIVPTWHVEVDPRAHKVKLLGDPHPDVEYLIASTCHADVFDHLEGRNVKLWHVFDSDEEGQRVLPPNEWSITGGCSVGLRAMTMARFLGFRDLYIYGMDGSYGSTGYHAAEHPNQAKGFCTVDHKGVTYKTTTGFLEAAKQTFHELNQLPDVVPHFQGEGLVQALAQDYVPEPVKPNKSILGLLRPNSISAPYRDLQAKLHHDDLAYGVGGGKYAKVVIDIATKTEAKSVLDYGCGKGYLAKALPFPIWEYDPAFPDKAESPRPADLVVCTDVLEHIEPELLMTVLTDLQRCVLRVGYFVVHTGPSFRTMADGRNTHILQRPAAWWTKVLSKFFDIGKVFTKGPLVHFVVGHQGAKRKAQLVAARATNADIRTLVAA